MKTGKIQAFHHLGTGPASRIEKIVQDHNIGGMLDSV
jgi:hypothetical protein